MKLALTIFVTLAFVLLFGQPVFASSLITVNRGGVAVVNVLGAQTERSVVVTKVVNDLSSVSNAKIALNDVSGKVTVDIASDSGSKSINATDYKGELVIVEERESAKKVTITKSDNGFILRQEGASVNTTFPIRIDAQRGELSVVTSNGTQHILKLPLEVAQSLINTKIMNQNTPTLELFEGARGELLYKVTGEKTVHILNLFDVNVPVKSDVSASTGEVISIDQPLWLKIFGFLFE